MIWHSDGTWVGVWQGNVNVHTFTLGTVSDGFIFHQRMLEAQRAWASALGITITGVTQAVNAQIRSWGGQRAEIEAFRGEFGTTWTGLAEYPTMTQYATHVINNTTRTVYRFTGQARMFVIQRSTAATWTQDDISRTRKTSTHELGHTLGYRGHSPNVTANNQDVMWAMNTPNFTLRQNEITHLRQMYDLYN